MPWPFGRFDVMDDALELRSGIWSWWVKGVSIPRQAISQIRVSRRLSATYVRVETNDGRIIRLQPATSAKKLLDDLRQRAYPVG